jgi:hypothetical protein
MRYDPAHKVNNMIWVSMLHCYGTLKTRPETLESQGYHVDA